jgi:hypothetical protein
MRLFFGASQKTADWLEVLKSASARGGTGQSAGELAILQVRELRRFVMVASTLETRRGKGEPC